MKGLGLTLLICLSVLLLIFTQLINLNPNTVIINALNKQSLITNYSITGLMTTSIKISNYSVTTSIPTIIMFNETSESYTFNLPNEGGVYSIKLIIENESHFFCENNQCSKADLSKLTSQRFAGVSAITKISELLDEELISLSYGGFNVVNGLYCDLINAEIMATSESFINYLIDGEVMNLSVSFCLERITGLPIVSSINAGLIDGSIIIEFKASELKI